MTSTTLWLLCGAISVIILLINDRESFKGADISYFVMITMSCIGIVIMGPVFLAILIIAMFLKLIFDR